MGSETKNVGELIHLGISIGIPALAALAGVIIGAWLTTRRERAQRKLEFIEKQLKYFYSPLLGLRNEIKMLAQLRVRLHQAADEAWQTLCEEARKKGEDEIEKLSLKKLSNERSVKFARLIDYDNKQLQEILLPAYRKMAELFRENFWLADSDTRDYYQPLIEFVEIWNRWLDRSIPPEVLERLEPSEQKLIPFYEHLQERHDSIRDKIKDAKV